jgi:GNAT superfamily N-acetyltransferase
MSPLILIKDATVYRLKQARIKDRLVHLDEEHNIIDQPPFHYEEIGTLSPITNHALELPLKERTPSFIERPNLSIHAMSLAQETSDETLSYKLFYTLYSAVAMTGKWWPLEEKYWQWRDFFEQQTIYVLCEEGRIVGFGSLDKVRIKHKPTKINFLGIIPSAQGKGYGSYLFNYLCDLCQSEGVSALRLDTAPEYDKMSDGTPALVMYLKKGLVEYQPAQTVCPSYVLNNPAQSDYSINQFNLPAYYKNNPACNAQYLENNLTLHWQKKVA